MRAASAVMAKRRGGGGLEITYVIPSGMTVGIKFFFTTNTEIDWGDGSSESVTLSNAWLYHDYAGAGTYKVHIRGYCGGINLYNHASRVYVTEVSKIGREIYGRETLGTFAQISCYSGCTALSTIPEDYFENDRISITSLATFAVNCPITVAPKLRLADVPCLADCTSFLDAFNGTRIGIFPSLAGLSKVTTIGGLCESSRITSIPSGSLAGLASLETVGDCIYLCQDYLIGDHLPDGWLEDCPKAKTFNSFLRLSKISRIPSDFFSYISGTTTGINLNLLCGSASTLDISLSGLFDNLANRVTNVGSAFVNCTALTGNSYPFWDWTTPPTTTDDCYKGCTNLADYASIPAAYL
jgi:hypothetical protein